MEHKTTFVEEFGADIDVEVIPLVEAINGLGFPTVSSCQGDPGIIGEGGYFGHVTFQAKERFQYEELARFTFVKLRELFAHMYDLVRLDITLSEDNGFMGWIRFRNERLEDISKRINVYAEGRGK